MFLAMGITSGAADLRVRKCSFFPCCGQNSTMAALTCTFEQVTLFFIPLFRFNKRYFISCTKCGSVYELEKDEGRRLEKDYYAEVNRDKIYAFRGSTAKICPNCRCTVDPNARYCPNCGSKLF
jgi:uncharacterized C2H2 Zn-finger protein